MSDLKRSFEDVADWCEKHLEEKRGPEIGMTFGSMLRAYGRLATLSYRQIGEQRKNQERQLNSDAEKLLLQVSTRFLAACESKKKMLVEPSIGRTNITYDPSPRQQG